MNGGISPLNPHPRHMMVQAYKDVHAWQARTTRKLVARGNIACGDCASGNEASKCTSMRAYARAFTQKIVSARSPSRCSRGACQSPTFAHSVLRVRNITGDMSWQFWVPKQCPTHASCTPWLYLPSFTGTFMPRQHRLEVDGLLLHFA